MRRRLRYNLKIKVLCVLLAIILWVVLKEKVDPGSFDHLFSSSETAP